MPLKGVNHFSCDLKKPDGKTPDCEVDFYYNPGAPNQPPPPWEPSIQVALNKVVAVSHPLTQYVTFYCCDEHAIEAIKRGQHLPPLPPKVIGATEADAKRAAAGTAAVGAMRNGLRVVKP